MLMLAIIIIIQNNWTNKQTNKQNEKDINCENAEICDSSKHSDIFAHITIHRADDRCLIAWQMKHAENDWPLTYIKTFCIKCSTTVASKKSKYPTTKIKEKNLNNVWHTQVFKITKQNPKKFGYSLVKNVTHNNT